MLIHSCGAALPQDLHDVLVALGLGSDYDELALVIERRGVGLDHIVRQVTIGKLGLKCTDTSGQIRFNTVQTLRRNYARRKRTGPTGTGPTGSTLLGSSATIASS